MDHSQELGLVARADFPIYAIQLLTGRHIVVGGGGGSANTGVANGFEVYEISHDGKQFIAEDALRHGTGPLAVMNFAVRQSGTNTFLVAGQDNYSQLYKVRSCTQAENSSEENVEESTSSVKRRNNSKDPNGMLPQSKKAATNKKSKIIFNFAQCDSVKTDFSSEPLQKIVRISLNGKLMATGGGDGCVRLWTFPKMEKQLEISGHSKEVDDVDFSMDSKLIASVSKDGKACVWDVSTGKCLSTLEWESPKEIKYIPKRCRFAAVEERPQTSRLFVLTNPIGRTSKFRSYVQLWDPDWTLRKVASCDETYAALAVRDDGRFVAAGTMFSGSVHIYIAFSLQRVHEVKSAHNMFVTALEFLPVSSPVAVTSTAEAAVVSASADRRVCIHTLQYRRSLPAWLAVVLIVLILFVTFFFCSFIGL